MTLHIVRPIEVTEANMDATNIALEPAWTAGTYNLGDVRRVVDMLYEVSAETTTEEPSDNAADWFNIGPANRYAAFDQQFGLDKYRVIETVTSNPDSITFTLSGLSRVGGIAFYGLKASNIRLIGTLETTGDVLDIDYDVQDDTSYQGSLWRWYFLPQSLQRKYLNLDLNVPEGSTLQITINNPGNVAVVGSIVMGIVDSFGLGGVGTTRSQRSRTVRKTDGTLTSLLRRTPAPNVGYKLILTEYQAGAFWRAMEDLDGSPASFSLSPDHPELAVYGLTTNPQTVAIGRGNSTVILEVESL